jgi:hypothetical protein
MIDKLSKIPIIIVDGIPCILLDEIPTLDYLLIKIMDDYNVNEEREPETNSKGEQ